MNGPCQIKAKIILALLFLTALPVFAQHGTTRIQAFEKAALAEENRGDLTAAAWLRGVGTGNHVLPPELSARARWWYSDYTEKYDSLRARVIQAITFPDHGPENAWRVHQAEAGLHLISYELEQGKSAAIPLVQYFMNDVWMALDHHIAVEPRTVIETIVPIDVPWARIDAIPSTVRPGECSLVSWQTGNATEAWLNGQRVELLGSMQVCPAATESYNLEAVGPGGKALAWATVAVLSGAPAARKTHRIHFDFDESVIRPDALDTMAAVAALMREEPGLMMRVEGHCDAMGADDYNMKLGMRRAQSVRDFFVSRYGLSPTRFVLVSKGEREPIAPNTRRNGADNPEGRQLNRRAEFIEIR